MNKTLVASLSFILFLVQSSILPFFFNGISQPDIWLVSIIIAALIFKLPFVLSLTVIGGLVQDLVISNFFGMHFFPYLIIAYGAAKYGKERYNRHWYVSVAAVIAGSIIYLLLTMIILVLGNIKIESPIYLLQTGLPFVAYNAAASLFLHRILWGLNFEREPRW